VELQSQPYIPNDLYHNAGMDQLIILTGPNMGGKSTYLRQTALIVILAQMGSFVPAREARLGCVDRIYTRVGASDNLARGRSTFMVEMVETAAILNQATDRSLVILDEIGRGTATFDGLSIAWAAIEHLHEANRCRTLFATHYHELTALSAKLPRMFNATVRVKEWQGNVVFLHEVLPGSADRSYGIQVAKLAGLPPAVIARAKSVLAKLEAQDRGQTARALVDDLPLFAVPSRAAAETTLPGEAEALIEAVNTLRVSKGKPPYKSSDILKGIAGQQAVYMASSGQISHLDAAGKRPFQRALEAGYNLAGDLSLGGFMSENILAGMNLSPSDAVAQWLADDPHTNTMLSDNYTEAGAGIALAGNLIYYCLDAALPKVTAPTPEPTPEPEPQPTPGKPKVYVSPSVGASGLSLRKEASETAREVAHLSARTELTCLEGADSVQKKVGVYGKWLMVKDARGNSGYVAAWLVVPSLDDVPEPEPEPAQMTVIVFLSLGSGGLRMRAQPSLGGTLVTILPGGSELAVLEDPSTARPKIGVTNQWLHVRDGQGHVGYVAAWYVSETPSGGGTPVPPPQPEPSGMTVYVSPLAEAGLRMRSGPSTSSSTVKTLPANARLTVLEPTSQAEAKIGAFNQWLNVKDAAGNAGYVAAWYVNK
jgi:uncharacterized protein YkwD